jgi:enamine deaminase RidA (YjgF/YER057c/UK114 family)
VRSRPSLTPQPRITRPRPSPRVRLRRSAVDRRGFPWNSAPARLQTRFALENTAAICEAAGTRLEHVCRRQAFHDDFAQLAASLDEWGAYFPVDPPASTTLEIGGPLPVPGAHLLLDPIAYCPEDRAV